MNKLLDIPIDAIIRIHGMKFKQEPAGTPISNGDRVLDLGDGSHGIARCVTANHLAVQDEDTAEIGIPISRVRKLTGIIESY